MDHQGICRSFNDELVRLAIIHADAPPIHGQVREAGQEGRVIKKG